MTVDGGEVRHCLLGLLVIVASGKLKTVSSKSGSLFARGTVRLSTEMIDGQKLKNTQNDDDNGEDTNSANTPIRQLKLSGQPTRHFLPRALALRISYFSTMQYNVHSDICTYLSYFNLIYLCTVHCILPNS